MIRHTTGDLLRSDEKFIAHGCNTLGFMGAGIAKSVADSHPTVFAEYKTACDAGQFTVGSCQPVFDPDNDRVVFNLGTQRLLGADASYWAVMLSFGNLFEYCVKRGIQRVGIPRIGAGIGGLDWDTVEFVINGIYEYVPNGPEIVVYTL